MPGTPRLRAIVFRSTRIRREFMMLAPTTESLNVFLRDHRIVGEHVVQAVARIRDDVVDRPAARGVLEVDAVALAGDAIARDEVLGRAVQVDAVAATAKGQFAKALDLVVGNFVPPRIGDDDAVEHAPHVVVDDAIAVGPHLNGRVHLVGLAQRRCLQS